MNLIFLTGLLLQAIIGVAARKENVEPNPFNGDGTKKGRKKAAAKKKCKTPIFSKSASWLYHRIFMRIFSKTSQRVKVDKYIGSLTPGKDKEQLASAYYIEKIRISYALIFVGNILALMVSLYISQNGGLDSQTPIVKPTWEEGSYALDVVVQAADDEASIRDIRLTVEPDSLSHDEAAALATEVFAKLKTSILGSNESLYNVTSPLNLPEALPPYPFSIYWESENPSIVRKDGRIDSSSLDTDGALVRLWAHLSYKDQWEEYLFDDSILLQVYPPQEASADTWMEAIMAAVTASKAESSHTDYFYLPESIGGKTVSWEEARTPDALYLWLIAVAAAIIVFILKDKELQKKKDQRDAQIDRDYPELVRKLSLYLGAGMTLKGAWKRVAMDNTGSKYLYGEMLFSVREMENGIPEREVYESFGKRVGIAKYRKLTGLFANHLQKGNKNLLQVLREEMELALEDRKKAARTIGEEMSTKLLAPMMLMLLIIMVIIMLPAFQMF